MGKKRDPCWIRAVISEGKRLLGRPRCRWQGSVKMDRQDRMGWL
jgi:hypothetical protein